MKISCDTCRQQFGELLDNPEERGAVSADLSAAREHLAECAACRSELMLLQAARETMRDFPVLNAPPDLQSRIRQQLETAPTTVGNNQSSEEPNVFTAAGATSVVDKPLPRKPFGDKPPKKQGLPTDKRLAFFNFLSRPANVAWVSCSMIVVAGFISLSLPRSEQYALPEPMLSERAADAPEESEEKQLKAKADGATKSEKAAAAKPAATPTAAPSATPDATPAPGAPTTETEPAWTPLPDLPPELSAPPPSSDSPPEPPRTPQKTKPQLPAPAPVPAPVAPKPAAPAPPPAASTPAQTRSTRARDDAATSNASSSQTRRNRASEDSDAAAAFSARSNRSAKSAGPAGPSGPAAPQGPVTRTVATQLVSPRSIGWAQISVNLPDGVRFADGTGARVVWRGNAPRGEAINIDFEVRVTAGSHPVSVTLQEVRNGEAQTVASRTVTVSGSR